MTGGMNGWYSLVLDIGNGGYWGAGLRGGGGRFNIARIALKWRENRERAEDAGNNPRDQGHGQTNPQQESSRALRASR